MALKILKPTSAGSRGTVLVDRSKLSKVKPKKSLLSTKNKNGGRNFSGRITMRHKGGGLRNRYRVIEFKKSKFGVSGVIETVEYDPNRNSFISLVKYSDGAWAYILAPENAKVGDSVITSLDDSDLSVGSTVMLKHVPQGMFVYAVELVPGEGAKIARSAGTQVQVMGGDKGYVQLKLPSGELRLVKDNCLATIGTVSNSDQKNVKIGKAGRNRRNGVRPTVRGVAMSYKHPHGAGQGKKGRHGPGGPAKDRWGNKLGTRTRKDRKVSSKFIIRRRASVNKFKKYKNII